MSKNSFVAAFGLVVRPFFEEMDGSWRAVKGICLASLVVTATFWLSSSFLSSPATARAAVILNVVGWFTCIVFAFCYGMLYWELHLRDQDKEAAKIRRVQGFTDVEKR